MVDRDTIPARLDAILSELRTALGDPDVLDIGYHVDADPGDGSGWCVCVGDTHAYGSVEVAMRSALVGRLPNAR
jgi:hypothetical protein